MHEPTLQRVLSCPHLPSFPAVARDVLELTQNPDIDLRELATLIEKDQALATKVLRTINSSYYGLARPCPTITRALAYLGLSTVKSIVLGFSLVEVTASVDGSFDLLTYWRRGIFSAAAARRLAVITSRCDPEEAFIAALMQDIGMLALDAALGADYREILAEAEGDHDAVPPLEQANLDITHHEVGAQLGSRWKLPSQYVEAIREHHRTSPAEGEHADLINILLLACAVRQTLLSGDRDELGGLYEFGKALFGLASNEIDGILNAVTDDGLELALLLEVGTGRRPDVESLLAQAEDARMRHQFEVQRETEELREANEALNRQATTDALTNIGNRQLFEETIAEQFAQAKQFQGNLAVIAVDLDHFKSVNDTFGHAAGDQVLTSVASVLGAQVGEEGTVCRWGGEEFAVILPGYSSTKALRAAASLCTTLAASTVTINDLNEQAVDLSVTASFGVAAFEPGSDHPAADHHQLMMRADKALYAAKSAGRNTVCAAPDEPNVESAAA